MHQFRTFAVRSGFFLCGETVQQYPQSLYCSNVSQESLVLIRMNSIPVHSCRVLGLRTCSVPAISLLGPHASILKVGYNITIVDFKDKILGIFRSLLESDHHGFSKLYGRRGVYFICLDTNINSNY